MKALARTILTTTILATSLVVAVEARAATCAGRPTDEGGFSGYTYGDSAVLAFDTPRVRVHYATTGAHAVTVASTRDDGVPDTVAFAGTTAEGALDGFAAMGFDLPPSDEACASNGGDGRIDIYLVKFNGADGHTSPDACVGRRCSSFALVESTFRGHGYANAEEGFATVVTHELFHAVQNVYDPEMDRFWAEGTAQWAMHALHPELRDFERQLPAFFAEPRRSIDSQPAGVTAGYVYGSAVWPLFLTLSYGEGIVREVFERARASKAAALVSTEEALTARGHALAEAFPLFGAWNVGTGALAGIGGYPDAARYPGLELEDAVDGTTAMTSGMGTYAYRATFETNTRITLETDPARNRGVAFPLVDGKANLQALTPLPAVRMGPVVVVVTGVSTKKTDAPFTLRFTPDVAAEPEPPAVVTDEDDGGGCSASQGGASRSGAGAVLVLGALIFQSRRNRRSGRLQGLVPRS